MAGTREQLQIVTPERFAQGMTFDEFRAQMTRNQERFAATEQLIKLDPDDLAVWRRLPRPLKVLVLAEDWCGDVIDNLPILGRLAAESGTLELRIFLRDRNLDLMDQYLNQGQFRSIPVFVFFDEQFREVGRFVERPATVTERRARLRQELYSRHPEFGAPGTPVEQLPEETRQRLQQALAEQRAQLKPEENQDVIRELTAIAASAAS